MTDQDQALQVAANVVITLSLLALAGYIAFLGAPKEAVALIVGIGGPVLLWRHSGRRRRARRGPPAALLPLACAAQLAYGCHGGSVSWEGVRWPWAARPQFAASHIALTPQVSSPVPSGMAGLYAKSSDAYPRLVDTSGTEYVAGTAWRLKQGAPGSPTEGDLWYDTGAHTFIYRDNSGNVTVANAGSYVALTGSQNVGGAKTFTSTANFTGGLQVASAVQSGASFFKACTITSAAAATPVVCLSAADVPSSASAKLATWHAYVNGGTGWSTTATCVIEDTAGNDLVTIAVAAMTSNTFIDDGSANVTKEARYRLGTGGASDAGLQISCNANGTGSDLVVVLSGSIQ